MNKSKIEKRQAGTAAKSSTNANVTTSSQTIGKPIVSGSFTIIDWCKCKHCGQQVSPSQCDHIGQILFSDDREYVVGFECWQCTEWITFPKNCR